MVSLDNDIKNEIVNKFGTSEDLFVETHETFTVLCISSLVDQNRLQDVVMHHASAHTLSLVGKKIGKEHIVPAMLNGDAVVIDVVELCIYSISVKSQKARTVQEPSSESVLRGPHAGFIEDANANVNLIRSILKTSDLSLKSYQLGNVTNTTAYLMYINGIINPNVLAEADKRLSQININGILESQMIEEQIMDRPTSIFPTISNTERPDMVAAYLLEGKFAIVTDGTPNVLIAPATLIHFFNVNSDYYFHFIFSSYMRILRFVLLVGSLYLPSFYIALTTFHPESIPTILLNRVVSTREGLPFPAFVEAMLMVVSFEAMHEAGTRLPKALGQVVSVVGGLIIGQAAVSAGLVSAAMVVVVGLTGIAFFVVPHLSLSFPFRMLRYPMMIMASMFGLFGIIICSITILIMLLDLRSFGVPYLYPLFPFHREALVDAVIRNRYKNGRASK